MKAEIKTRRTSPNECNSPKRKGKRSLFKVGVYAATDPIALTNGETADWITPVQHHVVRLEKVGGY